jgi:hypothetical protein
MLDWKPDYYQFDLKHLFAVMVCVAVACTVSVWVLKSDGVATLSEIRGLYVPTVPLIINWTTRAVPLPCNGDCNAGADRSFWSEALYSNHLFQLRNPCNRS